MARSSNVRSSAAAGLGGAMLGVVITIVGTQVYISATADDNPPKDVTAQTVGYADA
jgi:hypothetical protein